jgi:hypothetical protein
MIKRGRLAYLTSLKQQGATNLFTALPSSPQFLLSSAEFRINLCIKLSIDTRTVDPSTRVCPICYRVVEPRQADPGLHWDYHIETCTADGGNAVRHNDFQTAVGLEAARLGQPNSLACVVQRNPDLICDLLFPHLSTKGGYNAVVVDFSICHPLSNNREPAEPLAKAKAVEMAKRNKYKEACDINHVDFMPVVIETTGAIGQSAKDFFNLLLGNTKYTTDWAVSSRRSRLMHLIAVTLARSTAYRFLSAESVHRDGFSSHAVFRNNYHSKDVPNPSWRSSSLF